MKYAKNIMLLILIAFSVQGINAQDFVQKLQETNELDIPVTGCNTPQK